jgi:hypothetical protein
VDGERREERACKSEIHPGAYTGAGTLGAIPLDGKPPRGVFRSPLPPRCSIARDEGVPVKGALFYARSRRGKFANLRSLREVLASDILPSAILPRELTLAFARHFARCCPRPAL